MTSAAGGWALHPGAALRAAGFSFRDWESVRDEGLVRRVAVLDAAVAAAEAVRARLLAGTFPAAVADAPEPADRRQLSRWRAAVGRRRPVDLAGLAASPLRDELAEWSALSAAAAAATAELAAHWDADLAEVRRRLHARAADPAVRAAVTLLSPSFAAALGPYADAPLPVPATSRVRALEQRLALYLQRLTAKNETNGFFGPIGEAVLDPAAGDRLRVDGGPGAGPPVVFSSPRVAEGLAAAIAADGTAAGHLHPRRSPAFRPAGAGLRHLGTGATLPLTAAELALWHRADGRTPLARLAEQDGPALRRLLSTGAVLPAPLVDPWSAEPLDSLEAALRALPGVPALDRWRRAVEEFRAGIDQVRTGAGAARVTALRTLEDRFEALAGQPGRRGAGQAYADRGVVFTECEARWSVRVGGALARDLAAELAPALTYWAAAACQRQAAQRRLATAAYDRLWPGRDGVPLLTYLRAAAAGSPVGEEEPTAAERLVAGLLGTGPGEVELSPAQLGGLSAAVTRPVFTSLDLMIAAAGPAAVEAGRFRLVLGEAHAGHLLSVFPTDHFRRGARPDEARRRDEQLVAALQADGTRLGWLVTRRTGKIFQYPLPAVAVQMRMHLPAELAVPPAELTVRREPDGVALHDRRGRLVLLPATRRQAGFDPLAAFCLPAVESVPCGTGPVRLRVVVGRTVLQRAEWRCVLPAEVVRLRGVDRFLAARSWARELGLPDTVFVRAPGEPKPVLVDLRNPVSVDVLATLAGRPGAAGEGAARPLAVSEMLPGPDELWLGGDRPVTAELRILAVRG